MGIAESCQCQPAIPSQCGACFTHGEKNTLEDFDAGLSSVQVDHSQPLLAPRSSSTAAAQFRFDDHYTLGEHLAKGSFAEVLRATALRAGAGGKAWEVAAKRFAPRSMHGSSRP